jgi:ribosomal protein L11
MAKKAIAKKIKQLVTDEINHPPFIRTQIPANRASAAPPLGTMLGQVS